jgi:hypothetical protein
MDLEKINISVEILTGQRLLEIIDTIGKLRIEEFKSYPYLYISSLEEEKRYLINYA